MLGSRNRDILQRTAPGFTASSTPVHSPRLDLGDSSVQSLAPSLIPFCCQMLQYLPGSNHGHGGCQGRDLSSHVLAPPAQIPWKVCFFHYLQDLRMLSVVWGSHLLKGLVVFHIGHTLTKRDKTSKSHQRNTLPSHLQLAHSCTVPGKVIPKSAGRFLSLSFFHFCCLRRASLGVSI